MTPQEEADKFLEENGIDPHEESRYGHEEMNRIHDIADFCKIFDKFRIYPFKASLMHYIDTGTVSGNLALAVGQFAELKRSEGSSAIAMSNRILKNTDRLTNESPGSNASSNLPP